MVAPSEQLVSWSPIRWVYLGFQWTVKEASLPENNLSENGISEKYGGRLYEADDWDSPWWRNNAEIELDIELVPEENSDWNGLDFIF